MCRFLLVRSKEKIKPETFLTDFSIMCRDSKSPDGDRQGDGWGIASERQKTKDKNQKWDVYKSLQPIWEDTNTFKQFGKTNMFAVHARSAGFPNQRGILEYNQPYVHDELCFVFNGMIRGVHIPYHVDGKIGAQKIFSLLLREAGKTMEEKGLRNVLSIIQDNANHIESMNVGLINRDAITVLCYYADKPEYFTLHYFQDDGMTIVCSEPIGFWTWKTMTKGDILVL